MLKLFVNKTVKCEVINVEFLSWDLPLNISAIMVTRTPYTLYPFPLYSVGIL